MEKIDAPRLIDRFPDSQEVASSILVSSTTDTPLISGTEYLNISF
jgi:hypothetical protein